MDVMFEDRTSVVTPISILARTLPRNLVRFRGIQPANASDLSVPQTTGSTPLLKLSFTSAVEKETRLKESKVQLGVANFTYFLTADLEWLRDVSLFAKAPAGVRPTPARRRFLADKRFTGFRDGRPQRAYADQASHRRWIDSRLCAKSQVASRPLCRRRQDRNEPHARHAAHARYGRAYSPAGVRCRRR